MQKNYPSQKLSTQISLRNPRKLIWVDNFCICNKILPLRTEFYLHFYQHGNVNFIVVFGLVISVYLLSLPVAHLSDAPRKRLVVTGDSARIKDKITENSAWFFDVLGVLHRHAGRRFNVSSERQLIIFSWPAGDSNPQPVVTGNIVFTSPTLYLLS